MGEDTIGLKAVAWAAVGGWMGVREDWRHLLGWSPSSFISVVLAAMASPGHWHYWLPLSKGRDLRDHPGSRWPGLERWRGHSRRCRSEGLGPLGEVWGTSL